MESLFEKKTNFYYELDDVQIVLGDSFQILTKMKSECVDMIFADPPYFLSNGGITCRGGKMVSVNKGSWDKLNKESVGVEEKHEFNKMWIQLCKRVLKPNGSIWISGTFIRLVWLWNRKGIKLSIILHGRKRIHHQTWHVDVLPILQRQFYGHRRMIGSPGIFLIIRR